MENETMATELLHELKISNERWFIVSVAEFVIILLLVVRNIKRKNEFPTIC